MIFARYFDEETNDLKPEMRTRFKYGRIWQDDKIVVPRSLIQEVISAHHDTIVAGHWGIHRTVSMIRRRFVFPKLRKKVSDHVSSYHICQVTKADHHLPRGLMENVSLPVQKWQSIALDWIVGLPTVKANSDPNYPFDSILTVIDRATKMCHLIPTSTKADHMDLADQFIHYVVKYHGIPRSIITDRGSVLTSHFWQRFMSILNIKWRPSTAFHPQTNGQTERMNQTIKQLLINLHYQGHNWKDMLDQV